MSAYTAHDQSVLAQARISTVDPVTQRPLQPLNQVQTPAGLLRFPKVTAISTISSSIFGKHLEGPSSNSPFNLRFHSFFTRISRRHESHCISTSEGSQILGPPVVCMNVLVLLSEKLLIDLGLNNWPEKLRNNG